MIQTTMILTTMVHALMGMFFIRFVSFSVSSNNNNNVEVLSQEQLEDIWDSLSENITSTLDGRTELLPTDEVRPFDAASETDMEQQK